MKITYDKSIDAAYIYFVDNKETKVVNTYSCNPLEVGGEINLDFDHKGKLIGIEILDASKKISIPLVDGERYLTWEKAPREAQ